MNSIHYISISRRQEKAILDSQPLASVNGISNTRRTRLEVSVINQLTSRMISRGAFIARSGGNKSCGDAKSRIGPGRTISRESLLA